MVDGLATTVDTGATRPGPGASELTPSRLTYDTGCPASVRPTTMSSPVRHDSDTTDDPRPKPSRRGCVSAYSPPGVCSAVARMTWPLITSAARVPSRDNCSSLIGPGNFIVTAVALTGIRAGCPDAASWNTRITLVPSITTQTALSSDQLGREIWRPSVASPATPPAAPIHNDATASG